MKKGKYFYIRIIIGILAVYFGMLVLLLASERSYGGSSINNLGMAIWYSIVTISTVGYRDLVPISPLGHVIGIIFLLLSIGVLATIFGTAMSFLPKCCCMGRYKDYWHNLL